MNAYAATPRARRTQPVRSNGRKTSSRHMHTGSMHTGRWNNGRHAKEADFIEFVGYVENGKARNESKAVVDDTRPANERGEIAGDKAAENNIRAARGPHEG